ncbi:zinc-binding dehydrogenase, partial [Mycobacterium sp. ITM-2017-0098]
ALRFGADITVDPSERSPFDVWRDVRVERNLWGPLAIFECVGATGLIQSLVESSDMGTRIYCAGGWYTGDTLDITAATRAGVTIQFGGGPMPEDWYGTLDAIASGRLDPLPCVGKVITLDEVPAALDLARTSDGPPRIVVHPNGDI